MAFPPSRGLVSPCLSLSPLVSHCLPTIYVCVGWRVRLPKVLSLLVVFHCLPPPFLFPFLGWCARLFEVLSPWSPRVPHCSPFSLIVSPHVCLSLMVPQPWCVRLPAVLSPLVCLCWMVCPPSQGLVSPCLPSPFLFPFVGWCVRLLDVLSPLVSHCLLTCEPVSDGLSASPRSCLHLSSIFSHCPPNCLPLSPFLSPGLPLSPVAFHCFPLSPHMCACAGWCVRLRMSCLPIVSHCFPILVPVLDGVSDLDHIRLQEALSPHVSHCLPTRVPVLDVVPAFPRSCLLSCLPACLSSCFPLWRVVSFCVFSQRVCG